MILAGNEIGDEGARAIAKALKMNSTLSLINLQDNQIGDYGALAFAEALNHRFTLYSIDLSRNRIDWLNRVIVEQALQGWRNRNYRLWICSFIDHCRSAQSLNFDIHMFAFYFYPLLGIEIRI